MKILIIQLTRLGDIFCTIPAIAAIRKENPDAEIHFLVRSRFKSAAFSEYDGLKLYDKLLVFDTKLIMAPLVWVGPAGMEEASENLKKVVSNISSTKYDRVINLSYSPFSSYFTHLVTSPESTVRGYTRTSDLFLQIPDVPSQYFKSQVGIKKSNRLHVMDLICWGAGIKSLPTFEKKTGGSGIVLHVGASQKQKAWPVERWKSLVDELLQNTQEKIFLVGSASEKVDFGDALVGWTTSRVVDLIGKLSMERLRRLIGKCRLFVGCDSGPLHLASLQNTVALNLSIGNVRFWETGPVVPESRVVCAENAYDIQVKAVAFHITEMLEGKLPSAGCAIVTGGKGVRYQVLPGVNIRPDSWNLVEWLHFDGPRPKVGGDIKTVLEQIRDLMVIADQQSKAFVEGKNKAGATSMLNSMDELIQSYQGIFVPLRPLLETFIVMKGNIPPGPQKEVFESTVGCYHWMHSRVTELLDESPTLPLGADL